MTQQSKAQPAIRVLHLEDNENDHFLVKEMLASEGLECEFHLAKSRNEFENVLRRGHFDLIISDFSLPSYDGLKALALAQECQGNIPFIFFSGTIGEETAVDSLKTGATDYVVKQRPKRLVAAVRRALLQARERALREQAEEKIREQAALLDKAGDAIIVVDLNDRIVYWNKGAQRIYGWNAREASNKNADDLLANEDVKLLAEAKKQVLERGEWLGQLFQTTKDERKIVLNSRWTLLRDSEGAPKARLIINTDVTEMKKMEAQLFRAHRLESIGALAGGIAHDLNNVLAPILMSADLLAYELNDPESQKMLETMKTCARRGAEMVKQILSFARGVTGEAGVIQVKPLLSEMASLAKDTFPPSIKIETVFNSELPSIVGNTTQLHQVLMNLCVNARDAMPTGGTLRLEATTETVRESAPQDESKPAAGKYVVISIADTGQGMTPEVMRKIFDPFFTTKPVGKGTGLGLATVREIVKNHNGTIQVSSEVGKGTTFKIYLPATPLSEKHDTDFITSPTPAGNGETILVVDDEQAILEMVRGTLQSFNYNVISGKNGAEAVSLFQRHQHEISGIIMDMMMPVMDGPAAIRTIQNLSPNITIIGVSGLESQATLTQARDLRINAFLRKPFTMENLLVTLKRVLAEKN